MLSVNRNPSPRMLRQFAVACLVVGGLIAWRLGQRGSVAAAALVAAVALLIGAVGLLSPPSVRSLFIGLSLVTAPLGWAVSHLVLAALYFGVFTPIAFYFRLAGRDPLARRFEPQAATYWRERADAGPASRYYRQS